MRTFVIALALLSLLGQTSAQQAENNQQKPSDYQSSASPIITSKGNQETERTTKLQKAQYDWNKIVAISTCVMAAFTAALFIATVALWKSGQRHSERELRAYVSVTKASARWFGTIRPTEAEIEITNSGQTPAYEVSVVTTLDIHQFPRAVYNPSPDQGIPGRGTIGPHIAVDVFPRSKRPLTRDERERIVRGELGVFVFGEITYRDAFGTSRFTQFRTVFIGSGPDPGDILRLDVMEEGNQAS